MLTENKYDEDITDIPEIKSLLPEIQYINNTKVIRNIVEDKNKESYEVNVFKNIYTTVDLDHDTRLSLSYEISAFDKMIMDSIYSLLVSGNKAFTMEMVYRVLYGRYERNICVSEASKQNIRDSINKMRHIDVSIKCSTEMEARKKCISEITDYMLPLKKVTVRCLNGLVLEGWILESDKMPPLYQYAERTGQLITIPSNMISLKCGKKVYEKDIEIKRYLIQRIEIMKRNANIGTVISYQWTDHKSCDKGMFNYLKIDIPKNETGKKRKQKIDKIVMQTLDSFIDEGYIVAYDVIRSNRAIVKYNIKIK